jgi:AcrR family transcriptional regulator
MSSTTQSEKTRHKLLHAAGELFAKKGFAAVTVREIIAHANTHLSAMNYHFNSKENLYHHVLIEAFSTTTITEEDKGYLLKLKPKQALLTLIMEALKNYRGEEGIRWKNSLISHEIQNPSVHFNTLCETYLKPDIAFIGKLITLQTEQALNDAHVRFAAISMIGLLETFGLNMTFVETVSPTLTNTFQGERLGEMILETTLFIASHGNPQNQVNQGNR